MTLQIQLIKIPVSDIEKAVPFYRDVLKLTVDFVVPDYGWAQFHLGTLSIALYVSGMGGGTATAGTMDSVHFVATDFETFCTHLAQHKLNVDELRHQGDDGSTYVELQDLDGNRFKVMKAVGVETE